MYSALRKLKATERIHRIEEIHLDKLKDSKAKDALIETILKQIDDNYTNPRQITEDELKKELSRYF